MLSVSALMASKLSTLPWLQPGTRISGWVSAKYRMSVLTVDVLAGWHNQLDERTTYSKG